MEQMLNKPDFHKYNFIGNQKNPFLEQDWKRPAATHDASPSFLF